MEAKDGESIFLFYRSFEENPSYQNNEKNVFNFYREENFKSLNRGNDRISIVSIFENNKALKVSTIYFNN